MCPFDLGNVITAACPLIAARSIDQPWCASSPPPTPLSNGSLRPSPEPTLPIAPALYGNPTSMCITPGTEVAFFALKNGCFRTWSCFFSITNPEDELNLHLFGTGGSGMSSTVKLFSCSQVRRWGGREQLIKVMVCQMEEPEPLGTWVFYLRTRCPLLWSQGSRKHQPS